MFSKKNLSSNCSPGDVECSMATTSKKFQLIARIFYFNGQIWLKKNIFSTENWFEELFAGIVEGNFHIFPKNFLPEAWKLFTQNPEMIGKSIYVFKKLFFLTHSSGHVECILQNLVEEKFDNKPKFFRSVSKIDRKTLVYRRIPKMFLCTLKMQIGHEKSSIDNPAEELLPKGWKLFSQVAKGVEKTLFSGTNIPPQKFLYTCGLQFWQPWRLTSKKSKNFSLDFRRR